MTLGQAKFSVGRAHRYTLLRQWPGGRDKRIAAGVKLHYLGLTKEGAPRHPLYLARDVHPVEWE